MERLTAYGHSWVCGEGAGSTREGLVEVIARRLDLQVCNLGVGGSSTRQTAALVERQPPPPSELYVIVTGLNDARLNGPDPTALQRFRRDLEGILAALPAADGHAITVVVEQPHLRDYSLHAPHDKGSDEAVDLYNQVIRQVAAGRPEVVRAVVRDWDPDSMLAADTVHPNDDGHAAVARAVVRAYLGRRSCITATSPVHD